MKFFKIIVALALALLLITGCSSVSTQPDEQGLHYNGGPMASKGFKNCVGPSTKNYDSIGDAHYIYPHGQRTYSFTGQAGSEHGEIAVTTDNGSQEVDIPGFITFTLTSDCSLLRKFHEQIGMKYKAYDNGDGWKAFLNDYIYTPLNTALNKAAQDITPTKTEAAWQRLYGSTQVQAQFANDVRETLPSIVAAALGGDYIKINDVQISKPTVPEDLKAAIQQKNIAQQENAAQAAKNQKILTQYDTIHSCLKSGLSEQSCTLIFLEQNGADIPFLPVPQGGAINYQNK